MGSNLMVLITHRNLNIDQYSTGFHICVNRRALDDLPTLLNCEHFFVEDGPSPLGVCLEKGSFC